MVLLFLGMAVPLREKGLHVDMSNLCIIFTFLQDTWEDILIGDVELKGTVCCGR